MKKTHVTSKSKRPEDRELVFQFKITLQGIKPLIWRRIQVLKTSTFWDLHVALQDAMGWDDYHLHEFRIQPVGKTLRESIRIGLPDPEVFFDQPGEVLPDWQIKVADFLPRVIKQITYTYDFGDTWDHTILFEKELKKEADRAYPHCVAGERACPPEDCGGIPGYERFVKIMANPKHKEYRDIKEWYGDHYFPEDFDPGSIKFDDPKVRLKEMLDQSYH